MAEDNFAMGYALGQDSNSNNDGFGGGWGSWIWIILLLAVLGGGWGGGFGFGGMGGAGLQGMATRADINEGFALNNITGGITAIQQGICDSTYALTNAINGGFSGTQMSMMQGFNGVERGFCDLSHQLSDCCCENRAAIAQVRYDMATQACDTRNLIQNTTRDLIDAQNANTRQIMDFLVQDKISALQAENQSLKFAASQAAQNAFITANQEAQTAELIRRLGRDNPVPAYWVSPPTPVQVPYQGGCGCGC
jgi:hypothetical protein